MANGGEVKFKFTGDDKDLQQKVGGLASNVEKVGAKIGKTFATGATIATGAIATMVTASVKEFADLEQNVGGIQTLFGLTEEDIQDMEKFYGKSIDQISEEYGGIISAADEVLGYSKDAYKTAGLSANEYMETVTSFAASLISSLGGDTMTASSYADRAITDMSDNANKMGTNMQSIQNAYQGFAKQNYTMLDNLKLGYGGTQKEMQRLIADASKMTDIQDELNISVKKGDMSFSNIVNAISVVQKKMNITGTTAKEASETITGSLNSAKAAFKNFLAGYGKIDTVVETFVIAGKNIGKAVLQLLPTITDGLVKLVDGLIPYIPEVIKTLLPTLVQGVTTLLTSLITYLPQFINVLIQTLPTIIEQLTTMMLQISSALMEQLPSLIKNVVNGVLDILVQLLDHLPDFITTGVQLLVGLANGLVEALPDLIDRLPEIIEGIVAGLATLAPTLMTVAPILVVKLAEGLIKAIPKLAFAIPKITGAIISGLAKGISGFIEVGGNLIKGLWKGMDNAVDWLVDKVKGFSSKVIKAVKGFFGIHSPSKEFAVIGKFNMLGLEEGMEDMQPDIQKTIDGMFNLSPNLYGTTANNLSVNPTIIVNNNVKTDPLGQIVNDIKTFGGGANNDYNYGGTM